MRAGYTTIRARRTVDVSGNLRFADGSSPGGAPLSIEFQTAGSAWSPVARAELARRMPALRERMDPAAGLWIAWPKRASGVETDLTEDGVRELALTNRLVDNKVCAIDATWSGLRLVIRLVDRPA
jgi:hypothetical protein